VADVPDLVTVFWAHLPGESAHIAREHLEAELAEFLSAGRAAWPALTFDEKVFVQHLAERSPEGRLPQPMYAADLYLACACAYQVSGACEALDLHYSDVIARVVSRHHSAPDFVDEATQRLLEGLFVSSRGLPKIAEYGARAALRTWLAIAASRVALMLLRRETRARRAVEKSAAPAMDSSPELALMKRRYANDFAAAVEHAFKTLSEKERTILQLNIIDRLSIDAIAQLYKVGRSTAARWLVSARTTLADATRELLREKLHLTDSEYDGLSRLVLSEFDVSVARLLGRSDTSGTEE